MARHHVHHIHLKTSRPKKKAESKGPLDYFVYFFMFIAPLFEVPQAVNIYTQKEAYTVSLTTWALFLVASTAWLVYGLRNKLKPIIIIHVVYIAIESSVVIGILRYS